MESLNISSRSGYGTEITCTMIVGCIDNTKKSTHKAKGESGKPLKILIADDDRINSLMLKKLIEKMNHCVDSVSDGLAALEKVKQRDYDVVFMDIQMPVMNGIEALENIKNLPDSKNRPKVVAVTAYAMPGDQEKFLQAGFDDYISKPIDMELIEEALDRLF